MATSVRTIPRRSAFAAAFLSFIFPGLGHAYVGAYRRALILAALPLAMVAWVVIELLRDGLLGLGLSIGETSVLGPLAIANVAVLAYRAVATVDAYVLAIELDDDSDRHGLSRYLLRVNPFSITGVVAILGVMAAGHALAGYWDLRLLHALDEIHAPIVIAQETPGPSMAPNPTPSLIPRATFVAQPTAKPWDSTARLNILLVGVDEQDGGFRTDSMLVASIDPKTHRVALFSMPRDTFGLAMPPNSALSSLWGPYFNNKLNALWAYSDRYRDLFPNGGADALKQAMSFALFGRTDAIPYYVLVNFSGFETVVDTLGGVTVDVPAPLIDNGYPGNGDTPHMRIYVPAGMQHFNGSQALDYARARKGCYCYDDFNRSARQEQILVALEQQADLAAVSTHLGALIDALSGTIHTDIPEGPGVLGALIDQAKSVNLANIKTYAFSPTTGYGWGSFTPNLTAIRATVAAVTSPTAGLAPQAVLAEGAPIVVKVGSGSAQQAADLVTYLQSLGLEAQMGDGSPGSEPTTLILVNGADALYPQTFALLEKTLGLSDSATRDSSASIQVLSDPTQQSSFVIVVGSNTPAITPPPG